MTKKLRFHYDSFSDRLMISNKTEKDVIDGSIRILNLIIDFTTKGKAANIELVNASEYLESLAINSNILNKLTEAEFNLQSVRNGYLISIVLKAGKKIERVPYNIHLPSQKQVVVNSA